MATCDDDVYVQACVCALQGPARLAHHARYARAGGGVQQADHLFARFSDAKNPRLTMHSAARQIGSLQPLIDAVAGATGASVSSDNEAVLIRQAVSSRHQTSARERGGGRRGNGRGSAD